MAQDVVSHGTVAPRLGRDPLALVGHVLATRSRVRIAVAIFFVALIATLPGLGAEHVWSRDEARPALVAKEMLATGHWAIPHIGGRIDIQKPPLFPWIVALASPRGVSEWSLRFPSAVAAAATIALTYVLGAQLIAPAGGVVAAAILASSFTFFQWARTGRMEMVVVLFITLGCWSVVRWLEDGRPRHAVLLGVWIALGMLAKGPIAILPAVVAAVVLVRGGRRPRLASHAALCALTVSSILLLWLAVAWSASDDVAAYVRGLAPMLVTELTEMHARHMPLLVAGGFLPWTLILPAAGVLLGRSWRSLSPALLVPAVWIVTIAVIFSTILHPREPYFLPLYPPLALIVAYAWCSAPDRWLPALVYPPGIVVLGVVIATTAVMLSGHPVAVSVGDPVQVQVSSSTLAAQLLLFLGMALGYLCLRIQQRTLAAVGAALGILGFLIVVENGVLAPALNRTFPTAETAAYFARSIPAGASVAYTDRRHVTAIAFYLPRASIQLGDPTAFEALRGRRDVVLLLVDGETPLTAAGRPIPIARVATARFDGIEYVLATFSE